MLKEEDYYTKSMESRETILVYGNHDTDVLCVQKVNMCTKSTENVEFLTMGCYDGEELAVSYK